MAEIKKKHSCLNHPKVKALREAARNAKAKSLRDMAGEWVMLERRDYNRLRTALDDLDKEGK